MQGGRFEQETEVENSDPETVSVKSCLLVMLVFVVSGAVLFSVWEGWGYIDGSYFCFTSLLTIGFGDFVPGQTLYKSSDDRGDAVDSKLIICAVYLLVGMALLAMCFNLMQEEVFMKIKRFGRHLGLLRERFAHWFLQFSILCFFFFPSLFICYVWFPFYYSNEVRGIHEQLSNPYSLCTNGINQSLTIF